MAGRVETLFRNAPDVAAFAEGYFTYLHEVLARVDGAALDRVVDALLGAREDGRQIYLMGNGGSAATAGHFANDLLVSVRIEGKPFLATSLSENTAVLTAVSNDFGYEEVFFRQLEGRVSNGDLVLAFSASGNSPNVLKAVRYANASGALTIGFTGFDGGALREESSLSVHVPTGLGEYGPAEDAHLAIDHMLTNYLTLALRPRAAEGTD